MEPPIVPNNGARRDNSSGESPSSSLERNLKPSDFLRQKSSDSLDVPAAAQQNRRTLLADELLAGKKIKSENIEAIKKAQSPTSSLVGKSPTGSLNKVPLNRSGDSPMPRDNNVGSKESLSSIPGAISERVSYRRT